MNFYIFSSLRTFPRLNFFNFQMKIQSSFREYLQDKFSKIEISSFLISFEKRQSKLNENKLVDIRTLTQEKPTLNYGVFSLPHIRKRGRGGEDSYFLSGNIIVIADGVGGWKKKGIDPARYSKKLCENIKLEYSTISEIEETTAKVLLLNAAQRTKEIGSSTCCLLLFNNELTRFYSANIGDSGYMLIRLQDGNLTVIYKSEDQHHDFNIPFQLGTNGDNPETAITNSHEVKDKDIIITASDGLWDNLDENKILEILQKNMKDEIIIDTKIFAKELAITAENYSNDKNYISPFARKASDNKKKYVGGKPDDITVIVAQVDLNAFGKEIKNHSKLL